MCLSLHYNDTNSYLVFHGIEIYKFKAKDSEIITTSSCLVNISKDSPIDNMKKTQLHGYVYDFSVDYYAISFDDTFIGIHRHSQAFNEKH